MRVRLQARYLWISDHFGPEALRLKPLRLTVVNRGRRDIFSRPQRRADPGGFPAAQAGMWQTR